MKFSGGVKFFEGVVLEIFPVVFANGVFRFAGGVHKYLDVLADQLLNVIARRTLRGADKMKKFPSTSLQHYLSAAILGFILIVILIILSVRGL